MRVAIVYDRVNKWGGAERVLLKLNKIFPNAPLFTSVYDKKNASWARAFPKVYTSFLQNFPLAKNHHEFYALLMPFAFEFFNFDDYDLVISVTSEAAKGIITGPKTKHLSIILTPTRYLWSGYKYYFNNEIFKIISFPAILYLRMWDRVASKRPDKIISISDTVKKRVKKYYGQDSLVVYPPVDIKSKKTRSPEDFFLVVSRLVPYKKIDIAIKACNKLGVPLKIIGIGSQESYLESIAGSKVEFLGNVSEEDLKYYYSRCKALIFPGIEDFGLVMVEAQAMGAPVIAYRSGGACEIVVEGKTGEFFNKQTVNSLTSVLKSFDNSRYNITYCKDNAKRFSAQNFRNALFNAINSIDKNKI